MKLGVVVNATPNATRLAADMPLERALALASSVGFHGVELAVANPRDVDVTALRGLLAAHALEVPAIGTGAAYREGLSLSHPDAARREGAVARLRAHVDLAALLGADVIVGLICGRASDGIPREDALSSIRDHLRAVGEYAAPRRVRLLLESLNRYETDLLNTVAEALTIAEASGENVGLLADTFHMNIEEASMDESIRGAGRRIWHVHVADSNRWAPGRGHLDFRALVKALGEVGYRGYLSAEMMNVPDAATAYSSTYTHLAPLLGEQGS